MIVTFISVDLQGYARLFAVKLCFTDAGKIVAALPPPNTDHRKRQASPNQQRHSRKQKAMLPEK